MNELTSVALENEMDIILAHKQSMKLAELAGLSTAAQTTFATAVSEISRSAIGNNKIACLRLFVSKKTDKNKYISAVLEDSRKEFSPENDEGYLYAKRLISLISFEKVGGMNTIQLNYNLPGTTRIDDIILEKWNIHLNRDPAISPYEEIKRKNRELVEMANRLRESEQQYQILTDSLPLMIMTLDKEGRMIYANKWIYEYSGETVEQLNENRWINLIHPDDFEITWSTWNAHPSETTTVMIPEARLRNKKTGAYHWHTGVIIAISDDAGNTKCWNCFMVDIHAQKMVAQALEDNVLLRETKAELEDKVRLLNQSNQQLEQFAYVASHDLQEPLRKISFYSDYLKTKFATNLSGETSIFFENLINASERMKMLVQDVLAYSTIQSESFITVNLNQLIGEIIAELEFSIKEKSAVILVGEMPVIEANKRQLMQLFENLISNSIKYAHKNKRPEIVISSSINNNEVVISVSDNGIGFETQYIPRMFNLFQRLHTKDKYSGTGIGLAICKKIVDLHRGHIEATSVPENGATFHITLPIVQNFPQTSKAIDGTYIMG